MMHLDRRPRRVQGDPRRAIGDVMLHPVALTALVTLVANDHVLKARYGNAITGKLSDVAGLVVLPLLALTLAQLTARAVGREVDTNRVLAVAIVLTGTLLASVQLWDAATAAYDAFGTWLWRPAKTTQDPTDLLTLPALALAWVVGRDATRSKPLQLPDGRNAEVERDLLLR